MRLTPGRSYRALGGLLPVLASLACRPPSSAAPPSEQTVAQRETVPVIVTTNEALPTVELLARARERLERGDFARARRDFELLLALRHESSLEAELRFGYARALEGEGQLVLATRELEIRLRLLPPSERDAGRIELIKRLLLLEEFRRAGEVVAAIDQTSAGRGDRILLAATDGLARVSVGELDGAERALDPGWEALDVAGDVRAGERLPAAWLEFAAGEVATGRARGIRFVPVPDDVVTVLEARCQHMVTAQNAYAEAMRLEAGRLRLLAGERIAILYLDLHGDIMAAPLPREAAGDPERAALARGALLLRYEVLLEKAEQMLRITLGGTPDVAALRDLRERVELRLETVERRRQEDARAVSDLPVPQDDLLRVLESLGAPSTAGGSAR